MEEVVKLVAFVTFFKELPEFLARWDYSIGLFYIWVSGSVAADCIPHGYGFDLTLKTDSLASMYEIQLRGESDDFFTYSMTSTTEKFEVLDLQSGTKYIVRYRSRHGDKWEDFEKQQVYCITSSVDETVVTFEK